MVFLGCRTLLATHFHQLAALGDQFQNASCYCLMAEKDNGGLVFTYQIKVNGSPVYLGVLMVFVLPCACSLAIQTLRLALRLPSWLAFPGLSYAEHRLAQSMDIYVSDMLKRYQCSSSLWAF